MIKYIYKGDDQVKQVEHQTFREELESQRGKEHKNERDINSNQIIRVEIMVN